MVRVAHLLLGLLLLTGTGCGSISMYDHGPVTWDEVPDTLRSDEAPERKNKARPRAGKRRPEPVRAAKARPAPQPDEDFGGGEERESAVRTLAGMQIDRALTRFHAARAQDRKEQRQSHKHAIRWLRVLAEIDDACTLAPTGDDLGAFIRARISLEVELANDKEKKRALPPDLATRVDQTLSAVDARVAELRLVAPPGSLRPRRADGNGQLALRSPVSPMVVTSPFGLRDDPIHGRKRFHAGIDFGAPKGTMVYAATRGVVIYANWQGGYGRHIVLDHGDGIRTHYSHLEEIFISRGDIVKTGDTIGAVGATGRATGPHLHFAVTNAEGQFLDPQELINQTIDRKRVADVNGVDRRSIRRLARHR